MGDPVEVSTKLDELKADVAFTPEQTEVIVEAVDTINQLHVALDSAIVVRARLQALADAARVIRGVESGELVIPP